MSKNFNNGGRRYNNGVGSTENRNNVGRNGGMNVPTGSLVDTSQYLTESQDVKSVDITTQGVQNFFRNEAARIDKAIETHINAEVGSIQTDVDVMSFNLSNPHEKQPFVPFFMVVSANIIDSIGQYQDIPEIFKPDIDDGVHINSVYYDMLFRKFMYNKDDIKCFNSAAWRKAMHISSSFKVINTVKSYMKPKLEFPNGNRDNVEKGKIAVLLDPIRVFRALVYDKRYPKYTVNIKEANQIDSTNFKFRVERVLDHKGSSSAENLEILKQFLARGNSGLN